MKQGKDIKLAIYRCAIGDYDILLSERIIIKDADYFLFTDNAELNIYPYKTIHVDIIDDNPSLTNRSIKLKIPDILKEYDLTVYLDSNIAILDNLNFIVDEFLSTGKEMGSFAHPYALSIEEEINMCIRYGKADKSVLHEEIEYYNSLPDLPRPRLSDNSILLRKKPDKNMLNAMKYWYEMVKKYSGRDQISLPSVKSKFNIKDHFFSFSPRSPGNPYFLVFPHKPSSNKKFGYKVIAFIVRFALKLCVREIILQKNKLGLKNV